MAKRQIEARQRVDAFVAAVNASTKIPLPLETVPEPCRWPETTADGACNWRIESAQEAAWLSAMESQLPFSWPATFRALIGRYVFPSFVCGPVQLYSVGVKAPLAQSAEFCNAVMQDQPLITALWKRGYQPFARPADGSYDPLCFDYRRSSARGEPAVVRIDHERIRIKRQIAPAFYLLLEEMTATLSG